MEVFKVVFCRGFQRLEDGGDVGRRGMKWRKGERVGI